ncbi:TetR/AcrR family transcriptional regulator C-terminal domain-containing protein [Sphingobium nicotianae]|uniref:TetR/AcrR family transcriptional regulator C-terminal domain-containing protein n=1 Tax=Sphingobium nicotianae TaxID=2782607 RepID=A0A9X1DAW2_9SPHN|nr:TetR/AcrR family transcriptional regulator C-terminal domain-containing protein [Sphingobium nicotianae]MBT2186647.1 TetR/AcrR family transcriptional regulator C-terminal domain-containing protein [Sphingobium nicotianae]
MGRGLARRGAGVDKGTIVATALAVLDEQGLMACTTEMVAAQIGVDPAELAALFADRQAMLRAMAEEMTATTTAPALATGWRELLSQRAKAGREAMLSRRDGSLLFAQMPAMLPIGGTEQAVIPALCGAGFALADARAAMLLVDRFTIGAALAEQNGVGAQDGFKAQLEVVLAGIVASQPIGLTARRDDRQSRFQSSLWVFLRDARESANISFARTAHVNELDRRILLLLQAQGPKTLATISMACGVDKAQVSRAIKRMGEVSLLSRGGIRAPIRLSAAGRQLAERLLRQAELRNRELTFGISDEQIVTLFSVLDTLLARAITLFEQERKFVALNQGPEQVDFKDMVEEGLPDENGVAVDRSRVLPPFITLCSYMLRGGALAHKRRTGLSNFETWVHTEVCRNPPISWPQLVLALYRDQSQAGRTVNHLIDIGLVARTGKPGRRHGFFAPTEEGRRINDIIEETAQRRSEFLFQGLPADQLDSFMTAFETLAHNAEVQVARERAIQEMDRN